MSSPKNVTSYSAVLGAVLAQGRDAKNLTQQELAKLVGISGSTWSRIEKGSSPLTVDQLRRAAEGLGMSSSEVLSLVERSVDHLNSRGIEVRELDGDSTKVPEMQLKHLVLAGIVPIFGPVLMALVAAGAAAVKKQHPLPTDKKNPSTTS